MRKIIFILLCLGLTGCATTMSELTAPNRTNLLKLSIGMDKARAIEIMGDEPFHSRGLIASVDNKDTALTINNPYRSEILQGKDKTFEVIYYVTDVKKDDGAITDDELTPLVFDAGKLIGWGWTFLQDNAQKYEIRIR
ncbi:MAG: DUF3192 domain-containing protein [Candidatus Omnitrophota bacterium]